MKIKLLNSAAIMCAVGIGLIGCGRETASEIESVGQAVYVDTKTMKAIVAPVAAETPAVHPTTGERTLMAALYCPNCRNWHPVPPPDQINRVPGATTCRKTGATLTADGPWPE